jgi:hypothetical protein
MSSADYHGKRVQAVQEEKKKRSNIVTDNDGTHRSRNKYSSKKK